MKDTSNSLEKLMREAALVAVVGHFWAFFLQNLSYFEGMSKIAIHVFCPTTRDKQVKAKKAMRER